MANVNAPFGFRPVRHLSGGIIRARPYRIEDTKATTIGTGSPVKLNANGAIEAAAAGDRILGIFAGWRGISAAVGGSPVWSPNWVSGTDVVGSYAEGYVYDDPMIAFEVQSAGTPGVTNIGNLANHVVGTVNAYTGVSGDTLSGTMGTGSAGFRILDFSKNVRNEIGQYGVLVVQAYLHELHDNAPGTPGV